MNAHAIALLLEGQFISSIRSFPSVFYTVVLPIILFLIFGAAFNVDGEYAAFFLPGMIGVMISSDALFGIGPVMKEYFRQGIVREFRSYPMPLAWLFVTYILTRLIFVVASSALLITTSSLVFDYTPGASGVLRYAIAAVPCYAAYSFIALIFSFWGIHDNRDQALISMYYFLGMFLSDAFISLSARWPAIDIVSYIFPLKPMLEFMRGENWALPLGFIWMSGALIAFILSTRSLRITRR